MKFKNIKTGAILEPNSKFTQEQMEKSDLYVKVGVKDNKELSIAQITKKLNELGIEYDKKDNKETLLSLLPQE